MRQARVASGPPSKEHRCREGFSDVKTSGLGLKSNYEKRQSLQLCKSSGEGRTFRVTCHVESSGLSHQRVGRGLVKEPWKTLTLEGRRRWKNSQMSKKRNQKL